MLLNILMKNSIKLHMGANDIYNRHLVTYTTSLSWSEAYKEAERRQELQTIGINEIKWNTKKQ